MPVPTPPTSTPLSTPPSRLDTANFEQRSDQFLGQLPLFQTEQNALASYVYDRALQTETLTGQASTYADAALASKNLAESAAVAASAVSGATQWVSGSYATGAVVWSPLNGQNYRRKSPGGSSPTDPSLDPTNWFNLVNLQGLAITRITGNTLAVPGRHYLIAAPLVLTLPASPGINDRVGFTDITGLKNSSINPNGANIRGFSGILYLDVKYAEAILIASGSTEGWV